MGAEGGGGGGGGGLYAVLYGIYCSFKLHHQVYGTVVEMVNDSSDVKICVGVACEISAVEWQ